MVIYRNNIGKYDEKKLGNMKYVDGTTDAQLRTWLDDLCKYAAALDEAKQKIGPVLYSIKAAGENVDSETRIT